MPSLGLLEVHSVHWRHSQQPQAPWTVCPLADQTLVGGSQASVRAPGLSCRHVTRSTHRASGYQQAAICYSWSRGGLDFLEPNQLQRYIMHQDNTHKTGATSLCNTSYSQRVTQLILHRALVIGRQRGQESCRRSAAQGKGSTVGAKSPRARPCQYPHPHFHYACSSSAARSHCPRHSENIGAAWSRSSTSGVGTSAWL